MTITGAIFDLDGTILDSMDMWFNAGELYLHSLGLQAEKNLGATLLQMNMDEGAQYLKDHYHLPYTIPQINDGIISVLKDTYTTVIQPKPGMAQLLKFLSEQHIPCVIATSSDRDMFSGCLENRNLAPYFIKIFTCFELKTSKSVPFIFQTAADFLSSKPEHTLVFEDSPQALKTAQQAGFLTVGMYDACTHTNTSLAEAQACSTVFCQDGYQVISYLSQASDSSFAAV